MTCEEPRDIRLVAPDGREFTCDMIRDPDADADGLAAWMVVPREPLPRIDGQWRIRAGQLPAMAELRIVVSRQPGG